MLSVFIVCDSLTGNYFVLSLCDRFAPVELKVKVRTNAVFFKWQVLSQPITTNTIQLHKPGLVFLSFCVNIIDKVK